MNEHGPELYAIISNAVEDFLEQGEYSGVDDFLEHDEVVIEREGVTITINVSNFKKKSA
jgi:hypothetical protein